MWYTKVLGNKLSYLEPLVTLKSVKTSNLSLFFKIFYENWPLRKLLLNMDFSALWWLNVPKWKSPSIGRKETQWLRLRIQHFLHTSLLKYQDSFGSPCSLVNIYFQYILQFYENKIKASIEKLLILRHVLVFQVPKFAF